MKHLEKAISFDEKSDYNSAIEEYETSIFNESNNYDAYINLAFIYWCICSQYGWSEHFKIIKKYQKNSCDKYLDVLNKAEKFSEYSDETRFWRIYFESRIIYNEVKENEILELTKTSLIPFFKLNLLNPKKYSLGVEKLKKHISYSMTAKNLYITSLL